MKTQDLVQYLEQLLKPSLFKDYAPNGLQVEGKSTVDRILTAVTASQSAIKAAIDSQADALLVHHGYFWKGEPEVVVGMKQKRLKALLSHDINLIAYHLPLDAHPRYGNNIQLAKMLELTNLCPLVAEDATCLVLTGETDSALTAEQFKHHLTEKLGRSPLHISVDNKPIHRIGLCTGGGQDFIDQAAAAGLNAFISGEASERTYYSAIEQGIHYFGCGHHATEKGGVQVLGQHLAQQFKLEVDFFDSANPI